MSNTTKPRPPAADQPPHNPTKVEEFLLGHLRWPSHMRWLDSAYNEKGHTAATLIAGLGHLCSDDARVHLIYAHTERIGLDPATTTAIAAIANWWRGIPLSCGDVAVLTDRALDERHFPLIPHEDNLIFPNLALLRPTLEAAGLPADLRDSNGKPLHIVFGVDLQDWFKRGRRRSEIERAVDSVAIEKLPEFPPELATQFSDPKWIQSAFNRFMAVEKALPSGAKRPKAEVKVRADSIGTIASLIRSNMMALCAESVGVFLTSAGVLAAGKSLGIFNIIKFESDRDGVQRIARALGPGHLNLPWAKQYGARRWFLPAATMRERIKQEFLNLDWQDMALACGHAYRSFASEEGGMRIPEDRIYSWDRYWLSLVPVVDEEKPVLVNGLRQFLEPNEFPSIIMSGVMWRVVPQL